MQSQADEAVVTMKMMSFQRIQVRQDKTVAREPVVFMDR
jgi:hypothetical protein